MRNKRFYSILLLIFSIANVSTPIYAGPKTSIERFDDYVEKEEVKEPVKETKKEPEKEIIKETFDDFEIPSNNNENSNSGSNIDYDYDYDYNYKLEQEKKYEEQRKKEEKAALEWEKQWQEDMKEETKKPTGESNKTQGQSSGNNTVSVDKSNNGNNLEVTNNKNIISLNDLIKGLETDEDRFRESQKAQTGGNSGFSNDFSLGGSDMFNDSQSNDFGYDNFDFNYFGNSVNSGKQEEKRIIPKKTIQYTTTLTKDYPIYHDTGFYASDDDLVNYFDLRDAFKIVALKTNNDYIEDVGKAMIIIEGVPVLIENNNKPIDFLQVENAISSESIAMTTSPTRIEGHYNMTEVLEANGHINVSINDSAVDLFVKPVIKDSCVLLALRPVGSGLGAKVDWDKGTGIAKISKDGTMMKYVSGDKTVKTNEQNYNLPVAPEIHKDDTRIISTINLLVDKLDGISEWDTKTKTLHIYTKDFYKTKDKDPNNDY